MEPRQSTNPIEARPASVGRADEATPFMVSSVRLAIKQEVVASRRAKVGA